MINLHYDQLQLNSNTPFMKDWNVDEFLVWPILFIYCGKVCILRGQKRQMTVKNNLSCPFCSESCSEVKELVKPDSCKEMSWQELRGETEAREKSKSVYLGKRFQGNVRVTVLRKHCQCPWQHHESKSKKSKRS